jgi:hypothetical protein
LYSHLDVEAPLQSPPPLAPNEDFTCPPVDVLKLQSDDLAGRKAKTGKQKKDGIVTAANRGLRHCPVVSLKTAQWITTSLRSFLRFGTIDSGVLRLRTWEADFC